MCSGLQMQWVAGRDGGHRVLSRESEPSRRPGLIGPLNFNIANRVQLLGAAECSLVTEDDSTNQQLLEKFINDACDMIVVTDKLKPPERILQLAETLNVPVFVADASYNDCLNTLRYRFTRFLAKRSILHGVLMDVLGTGVLITGDSGIGKSELALELISRGHILVADDAPEFRRIAPDTLEGQCPELLQDFLEVRGLGTLNVARMYGNAHTRKRKILKFIVRLQLLASDELAKYPDRASEAYTEKKILGVTIREQMIPVAPGRNLAVLVEAAVRNHILANNGYRASEDLITKQAAAIEQSA